MGPIDKLNKVGNAVREKAAKPSLTIQIGQSKPESEKEEKCCPNCGCPLDSEETPEQQEAD